MVRVRTMVSTAAILLLVAAVISGAALFMRRGKQSDGPSLVNTVALDKLPAKDASGIDTSHLADGLAMPTNKWFSGLALQKKPQAVFPTPLRFATTESSFAISLPEPAASTDTIMAATTETVTVAIDGATAYKVTRYDELSVDLTYLNGTERLATVVLVAGSPYIQLTAHKPVELTINTPQGTMTVNGASFVAGSAKHTYHAVGTAGVTMQRQSDDMVRAKSPTDSVLSFFGLPAGQSERTTKTFITHATNHITGTRVDFAPSGNQYSTDITVQTANGRPTIFCYLPHQQNKETGIMTIATIYGEQRAVVGSEFRFTTPAIDVKPTLNLSKQAPEQKQLLTTTLRQEINATRYTAIDTYFSGKELYRSAQLLQLAKQLDETAIAGTIQSKLRQELAGWLTASGDKARKYFYYDSRMGSIVGEMPSFGSEAGNDHHFHYGYFIYAAAILSTYDTEFASTYGDDVDLLVADLANYKTDEALPLRRLFDPYFGHSWASGSSPFDDGNNQESISEALNAWTGMRLWADQTGNRTLAAQAGWMLSVESSAARVYWLSPDTSQTPYSDGYRHSFVSLNWGGKRDNATFFSAEPNARLGILLIPMNPTMSSVLPGKDIAEAHLQEAIHGTYDVQFGDYLLMYRATLSDTSLLETARALADANIDGANSRSYMYAWIMSQQQ